MLQKLLPDLFKRGVHRETKDIPSYDIVIAKGGAWRRSIGGCPYEMAIAEGVIRNIARK